MIARPLAIIPCFNEEANLKQTVESLKTGAPDVDFIVVNDGSSDGTHLVCLDNGYPAINMPFNLGLAGAVQTGMRYACANDYAMALQFDGDGQHQPEYIAAMVRVMQETSADIVIGSRYMRTAHIDADAQHSHWPDVSHEPPAIGAKRMRGLRGFGSLLLKAAIKATTGRVLTDPTSGMRLYNRRMIETFANYINYGPEPDTLVYLLNHGAKVVETPVIMRERSAGESYLGAFTAVSYMLRMIVSIVIVQRFRA